MRSASAAVPVGVSCHRCEAVCKALMAFACLQSGGHACPWLCCPPGAAVYCAFSITATPTLSPGSQRGPPAQCPASATVLARSQRGWTGGLGCRG